MARVLITGCAGFVGRYLVDRMIADGHDVWGVDRAPDPGGFPGARRLVADLTDGAAVTGLLADSDPEWIVHLAAQSSVRSSFDEPLGTLLTNVVPTLAILDDLRRRKPDTKLLAIGSADEYGPVETPEALPLTERSAVNPVSPYALGKSIQNQCCRGYAKLYGVDVVVTRSFNHTGPGQRDSFVLPSFARQIVEIRKGLREPVIQVGNLEVKRDFLDVRDVCAAYALLLEKGEKGETYNVCSGRSHRIRDLLDRLCAIAGVKVTIEVDPARLRKEETPELRGDATRLKQRTGWEPKIPIEDTLRGLVEYWDGVVVGSEDSEKPRRLP